MPLQTTPVISSKSSQYDVAKSQLRFGQVPSDKISIRWRKFRALQSFPRQQQPGATVHHQSGGLREWNTFCVAMMLTTRQQTFFAADPAMAHDYIVVKHAQRAPPWFGQRKNFEFNFHASSGREVFRQILQRRVVAAFIEEVVSAEENIEFQIVIGLVAC